MKVGDVVVRKGTLHGRTLEEVRADEMRFSTDPGLLGRTVQSFAGDYFNSVSYSAIEGVVRHHYDRIDYFDVVPETRSVPPAARERETFWTTLIGGSGGRGSCEVGAFTLTTGTSYVDSSSNCWITERAK